jgi:hypothetical protein
MATLIPASFLALTALTIFAQSPGGTITGTVSDPDGHTIPTAVVQARNTATGAVFQTVSTADGKYTLALLPPATYDIATPSIGYALARFERKGVVVGASQSLRIDVELRWGPGLGTPGDDSAVVVRRRSPAPLGSVPRAPDGKPDLSGVWLGDSDPTPERPALLPWAEALVKERAANGGVDNPSNFCLPADILLVGPGLFRILQTPTMAVVLIENSQPAAAQIFLDGRDHPRNWDPSWMGHSTGRWAGDTLVVDSMGYNDRSWLGFSPHTEMLHVISRYRRIDLGHLDKEVTVEDIGTFTKPWKIHVKWELAPGEEVQENICENNRDAAHFGRK